MKKMYLGAEVNSPIIRRGASRGGEVLTRSLSRYLYSIFVHLTQRIMSARHAHLYTEPRVGLEDHTEGAKRRTCSSGTRGRESVGGIGIPFPICVAANV